MRLLQMTDVHFFGPGRMLGKIGKRALGLANLYIRGRRNYFDADEVVPAAVQDALRFDPDLFCMTGDVTAMSSPSEFRAARRAFAPLLDSLPSVVIPGNHDIYTRGAQRRARMERTFGAFMWGGTWQDGRWSEAPVDEDGAPATAPGPAPFPTRFRHGPVDIIATNPCKPGFRAEGSYPPGALERAEAMVAESRAAGQIVVYAMHYPVVEPSGETYTDPGHALLDIEDVLASLRRTPPHLLMHGHKHTAFRQSVTADDGSSFQVLGCGSTSALSPMRQRAAGYYLIDVDASGVKRVHRRRRDAESGAFVDDETLSDPV